MAGSKRHEKALDNLMGWSGGKPPEDTAARLDEYERAYIIDDHPLDIGKKKVLGWLIAQARQAQEWIPVSEPPSADLLAEQGEGCRRGEFLVGFEGVTQLGFARFRRYDDGKELWSPGGHTHWMPLPDPPGGA